MTASDLPQAVWRKSSYSTDQANCVEVAFTDWHKSSYSSSQANCVEVARSPHTVAVRDSKNPAGDILTFPTPTWATFLATHS